MTQRQALQQIASGKLSQKQMIALASSLLVASIADSKSELKKQAADRARAMAAIHVCHRVIQDNYYPQAIRDAADDEAVRLSERINNPDALRTIYRRNEARKAVR